VQRDRGFRGQDRMDRSKYLTRMSPTPRSRVETYRYQFQKAAEIADWKKLWHPRGEGGSGSVKRGLGIASAHGRRRTQSQCRTTIHADGSVLVEIGTQDLGTDAHHYHPGSAETLGLPMRSIKLAIGSNDLRRTAPRAARPPWGRFVFDAQGGGQRAGQAVRSGRAGAGRAARTVGAVDALSV